VYGQAAAETGPRGETVGYVGTITDITDRKLAEDRIRESLREKELLLKEVHHRVKNNLQITAGLFSLQAATVDDKQVREVFRESENRIKSMALVHEMLYQSADLARIDLAEYVESLTQNVLRSYGPRTAGIDLQNDLQKVSIDIDKAIPFGLILNELIGNCAKHAFAGGEKGNIWITLRADREVVLTVADNGRGVPAGFNFRATSSLGLRLVNTLAKQLKGTIELTTQGRTEFRLAFPA
jgi:two-component sensor histidine kinase